VRFCEAWYDKEHPLQDKIVKEFTLSLLTSRCHKKLGKNWITCCQNWHCCNTRKFIQPLHRQWANANFTIILGQFFYKEFEFCVLLYFALIPAIAEGNTY
jgi:hypothetical protein